MNRMTVHTRIMFQIINHEDGTRTPPMKTTMGRLRGWLHDRYAEGFPTTDEEDRRHDYFEDFVLIVCDDSESEDTMLVSDFPLFRVKNALEATDFIEKNFTNNREV